MHSDDACPSEIFFIWTWKSFVYFLLFSSHYEFPWSDEYTFLIVAHIIVCINESVAACARPINGWYALETWLTIEIFCWCVSNWKEMQQKWFFFCPNSVSFCSDLWLQMVKVVKCTDTNTHWTLHNAHSRYKTVFSFEWIILSEKRTHYYFHQIMKFYFHFRCSVYSCLRVPSLPQWSTPS